MHLTIAPRDILQIDDARITYRNFRGEKGEYNRNGERNFALIIPNEEIKEALINNKSADGAGWNVRIKPPYEDGDAPFMYLPVKVNFNDRGPAVYLISGNNRRRLYEEDVARLDRISIAKVDLDIAPSDRIVQGVAYRTAYLRSIEVTQDLDRFEARWAEEREDY